MNTCSFFSCDQIVQAYHLIVGPRQLFSKQYPAVTTNTQQWLPIPFSNFHQHIDQTFWCSLVFNFLFIRPRIRTFLYELSKRRLTGQKRSGKLKIWSVGRCWEQSEIVRGFASRPRLKGAWYTTKGHIRNHVGHLALLPPEGDQTLIESNPRNLQLRFVGDQAVPFLLFFLFR